MRLPVISETRSINFICWFTYFYTLSFCLSCILLTMNNIASFMTAPFFPLITFGFFALSKPHIFILLITIPIILEKILIKKGKLKKLTPTVKKISENLLIGLTILIIIGFYLLGYSILFSDSASIYEDIKDYNKIARKIQKENDISHFPKTIPETAEDPQLWGYLGDLKGEVFILKFGADKEFIQKELKKHKFLNANTPIGTKQKIYFMYTDDGRITSDGYTFYVLDKEGNYNENEKYFPYYSGIAVDKNMSHILYYHIVKGD